MNSYNLTNQLKLQYNQDKINNLQQSTCCYIHEWVTIEDKLYGFGVNEDGIQVYIRPRVQFGLYCMVRKESCLTFFKEIPYVVRYERILQNNIKPTTTIFDTMIINDDLIEEEEWVMYKLIIHEFSNTKKLYNYLSKSDNYAIVNYIKVPCVWTIETFILLEMLSNKELKQNCYFVWIDDKLKIIQNQAKPPLPTLISYDFETVSPDTKRVPIGNIHSDILFSASIAICTSTTRTLYSLVYLPLDLNQSESTIIDTIKSKILKLNKNDDYQNVNEHLILIYNSEKELVKKCLELFDRPEFYIAIGFNSKTYDLPFILRRCVFLTLPHSKYFYVNQDILTYKYNMLHIDLFLLYRKYFTELGQYISLNKIAKVCLNESKVDVNAVNIRFMFEDMLKSNTLDLNQIYMNGVTLDNCIYYNDVDTLLLLKLWINVGYHTSIQDICRSHDISLVRISQSLVNEYISVRVFKQGLLFNKFLTHNHNNIIIYNDILLDYGKIVNSSLEKESFMGGFNYKSPKTLHNNINAMDYVAYYPYIINGFNLSYETVSIVPLSIFGKLETYIKSPGLIKISFDNIKFYRFINHKGDTDVETIYQSREFINKTKDHGGIMNYQQIMKLLKTTSPIMAEKILILMIHMKEKGMLSSIIEQQNKLRDIVKLKTKELNQRVSDIQNLISYKASNDDDDSDSIENNNTLNNNKGNNDDEDDDEEFEFPADDNNDGADDDDDEEFEFPTDNNEDDDDDIIFPETDENNDLENEHNIEYENNNNDNDGNNDSIENNNILKDDDDMKLIQYNIDTTKDLNNLSLQELQDEYKLNVAEATRFKSIYRTLKLVNSSMYGVLGAQFGSLRGVHVAAAVTFLGRYHILEAAHHGLQHNYECVFIDTDSVFLCKQPYFEVLEDLNSINNSKNNNTKNNNNLTDHEIVPKYVKSINEHLVLTVKDYPYISIFAKKRYIVQKDDGDSFSKSITKNGPKLWEMIIENLSKKYLFQNQTTISNLNNIFDEIFTFTYNYLEQYGNNHIIIKRNAKEQDEYKTDTPMKRLLGYINQQYPEYTKTAKSLSYFYYVKTGNDVNDIILRPDFELDTTLPEFYNLFKFYSPIFKSIFDILNVSVVSNMEKKGIYITLDEKDLFKSFKSSFVKIRNNRFNLKLKYK